MIPVLKDVENKESQNPSVLLVLHNGAASTIVYRSQPTMSGLSGHPILTDFGQMRLVEGRANQDWWMSDPYRARKCVYSSLGGSQLICDQSV